LPVLAPGSDAAASFVVRVLGGKRAGELWFYVELHQVRVRGFIFIVNLPSGDLKQMPPRVGSQSFLSCSALDRKFYMRSMKSRSLRVRKVAPSAPLPSNQKNGRTAVVESTTTLGADPVKWMSMPAANLFDTNYTGGNSRLPVRSDGSLGRTDGYESRARFERKPRASGKATCSL